MGFFDRFRKTTPGETMPRKIDVFVGAAKDKDEKSIQSFSNSNITFSGSLVGYDYDGILRDKQTNIVSLYQLADYFSDEDPIIHGIIKHVYVPFSSCSPWVLTGKPKTVKLYEEQYEKMRLREKIDGIFLEFWKYGNVFVYLKDGDLITLPVDKCRIGNVSFNGTPIVEYNCETILNEWRAKSYSIQENWIKDNELEDYFKGFPEEVVDSLNKGYQYAQLNPEYTFVLQGSKESWHRYAIPFIASCLSALAKKELISQYEDALLNLAIRSFVHVKYGDPKQEMLPDKEQITAVRRLFADGMSGYPLVVTNHLAEAKIIQPDMDDLFQWDKYRVVNNDILSAGGISGIIVSGVSEDGSTFASAQVSMQTAEARINAARAEFCDMMNKVNKQLTEVIQGTYNLKEIPKFEFAPLSMEGRKVLRETCTKLWESGAVSTKTMLETNGYSLDQEKAQREKELQDGTDAVMNNRKMTSSTTPSSGNAGRPTLDVTERKSDPESSERSKEPKPSSPEGSMDE